MYYYIHSYVVVHSTSLSAQLLGMDAYPRRVGSYALLHTESTPHRGHSTVWSTPYTPVCGCIESAYIRV